MKKETVVEVIKSRNNRTKKIAAENQAPAERKANIKKQKTTYR